MANFEQWNASLERSILELEREKTNILIQVAKTVEGEWKQRIFNDGLAANGTKIGKYSTKPTWATIESFDKKGAFKPEPRKRAVNKGSKPGAKGTPRTSVSLSDGVEELRRLQGKRTDTVDLQYEGSLIINFQIGTRGDAVVYGTTSITETVKKNALEKHFNKEIFSLSEQEVETGTQAIAIEINNALFK